MKEITNTNEKGLVRNVAHPKRISDICRKFKKERG